MNSRMSDKLIDKLRRKMDKQSPMRSDLVLADFRVLDEDKKTAEILVQFDEDMFGVPTKELVAQTITELYKAHDQRPRLTVDLNTMRYYPEYEAVACTVSVPRIRRPFDDTKRFQMTPIVGGTMFLGENMEDTWKVGKSAEGHVYIERLEEDDIDTILRERSKARSFRTHAGVNSLTLNRIAASCSEVPYSIGDHVKCAVAGKLRNGEIVGLTTSGAQIRFKNGEQMTVASESLHGLVQAAEKAESLNLQALKDYYRKAYGYSEEDLNKLVSKIG